MPVNRRYSFGVDQPIGKFFRFRGTVSRQTGDNLFRSRNANAPVDGVRPDPSVLNITELESTARSLNQSVQAELLVSYPPRRLSAIVSYAYGKAMGETDGVFSLPPDSVDLTGEWGPTRGDARHRVNAESQQRPAWTVPRQRQLPRSVGLALQHHDWNRCERRRRAQRAPGRRDTE